MSLEEEEEDWMKCTEWLARCGVLTQSQKCSITSVEHLASILKDGVLLCDLLNTLKPGCVSQHDFNLKPQDSYFICQKNIKTFLRHCKITFKIRVNLFDPMELLFLQDFKKVIHTLSLLSQSKVLKELKIECFTADLETDYVILQDIMDECENEYSSSMYGVHIDNDANDNNDIYDSLVSVSLKTEKITKKECCLEELRDTERNFIDVIELIYKYFMKPLKGHLGHSDYNVLFYKIEDLKQAHLNFNTTLQRAKLTENQVVSTSRCFKEAKSSLFVYGEYCSKVHLAHVLINKLLQKESIVKDIIEEGNVLAKVKLCDLLIVPCQRIMKYHLFIKELLKNCQDRPEEVVEIKKALEIMQDLGIYINEVKRDAENMNNIYEITTNITDIGKFSDDDKVRLEKYGRLHFDGSFSIKQDLETTFSKRYVFLFDKLLLICKPCPQTVCGLIKSVIGVNDQQTDLYSYKGSILIEKCTFRSTDKASDRNSTKKKTEPILLEYDSKEFLISSDRPETQAKLLSFLQMAKDNTTPSTKGDYDQFILTNFPEPTECDTCRKLLRGLLSQGYKCKKTKMVLHKECLPKTVKVRVPIPIEQVQHHRKYLEYKWFSPAKNISMASNLLRNSPRGTFLVRWSENKNAYVISIKLDRTRHMTVLQSNNKYYFKISVTFDIIPALVEYYKVVSLVEAFPTVDSTLVMHLEETPLEKCRAICDFSATDSKQLTFSEGDVIEILSRESKAGWWRGRLEGKKGIFPSNYVELLN